MSHLVILAFESGGDSASVALRTPSGAEHHDVGATGQSHSSQLLPMAQALLHRAGLGWSDVDAIAVGTGPGSFTGLRMACGLAQGLALGGSIGLLPVSAFEAWAYAYAQAHGGGVHQLSMSFDARLGERFAARVEMAEHDDAPAFCWLSQPEVVSSTTVQATPWTELPGLHDPAPGRHGLALLPLAVWMARYASRVLAGGRAPLRQPADVQPLYVRHKVARTLAERAAHPDLQWSEVTMADLPLIMDIERSAYAFPWSEGNFSDSLQAGYHMRILREHGTVIGYLVWMMVVDEAHLLNITVMPARQGRGLGAWMMRQFMAQARALGAGSILLEVRPSNRGAIGLYRRLGCREIGMRKGYYPRSADPAAGDMREDALVMRRVFSEQDAPEPDSLRHFRREAA